MVMGLSTLKVSLSIDFLYLAEFRMTVFRPFVGEVLTGRIMAATHNGIRISLEFFDDISIPSHLIFPEMILYQRKELS